MSKKKIIVKAFLTAFCCFFLAALSNAESCSTAGQTQNKYTASGCSYTTQTRTCCAATGAWSDWGGSCPSCSSSQCWNGSKCTDKEAVSRNCFGNITNATGGTQTRTATCTNGSGWTYGSWTGTCTCKSGYEWWGSECRRSQPPMVSASCVTAPTINEPGNVYITAQPDSKPSADFSVTIAVKRTLFDDFGNIYSDSNKVNLTIRAGQTYSISKDIDFGCPYSGCGVHVCTAEPEDSRWL